MEKLLKLDPHIAHKVWGGNKLERFSRKLDSQEDRAVGEIYTVSTHRSGQSLYKDTPLGHYINLPYLIKFIDTADNLSIQVHPDDSYALKAENDLGKFECWIITEAQVGGGLYLGFKEGVSKKEFKTALKSSLNISHFLNFIPVKKGECFLIPPGTIHSIGKGVTLCEVQQSSGVTYRVWDWDRPGHLSGKRELHIDKALDVINFKSNKLEKLYCNLDLFNFENQERGDSNIIYRHKNFFAKTYRILEGAQKTLILSKGESLTVLAGEIIIEEKINLTAMESVISIVSETIKVKALCHSLILLVAKG